MDIGFLAGTPGILGIRLSLATATPSSLIFFYHHIIMGGNNGIVVVLIIFVLCGVVNLIPSLSSFSLDRSSSTCGIYFFIIGCIRTCSRSMSPSLLLSTSVSSCASSAPALGTRLSSWSSLAALWASSASH